MGRPQEQFEGMVVHYNHPWVQKYIKAVAICLGRHVFTSAPSLSEHTLAHEYCHVAQYEVYGLFGYLVRWFYWTWKVGYYKNPFEQQAQTYADWKVPPPKWEIYDWPGLRWFDLKQLGPGEQGSLWPN